MSPGYVIHRSSNLEPSPWESEEGSRDKAGLESPVLELGVVHYDERGLPQQDGKGDRIK